MLGDSEAMATVAVTDLDRARRFYEGVLGLRPTPNQEPGTAAYQTGRSILLVYPSHYAGTNRATAATFRVGNKVDAIVKDLRAKGMTFEHYELPDTKLEGDIHVSGHRRLAWLKDPDGNVLAFANG